MGLTFKIRHNNLSTPDYCEVIHDAIIAVGNLNVSADPN